MKFDYNSSSGLKKEIPQDIVDDVRAYLIKEMDSDNIKSIGQLNDLFLNYRPSRSSITRLMIHQLEPMFIYVARTGRVWD